MADFLITFSSTTAQTLLDGEKGIIGTSGTLAVTDAQAIGVEGEADLLILGSVTALKGDGVGGPAVGILELVVGTTGHLTALDDAAVDIAVAGSAVIRNQGNIIGSAAGIVATDTDGSAGFRLSNGGTILADGAALLLSLGNGTVNLTNSGRIETQGNASAAAIDAEGGVIVFDQTGTVVGDVLLASVFSTRLVNAGTILGDVFLGTSASADSFVNLGGRVSGTIFGGAGDDIYTIDRGDLVLSDSSGVDTVRSSASYQLAAGLDILTLIGSADIAGTGNGSSNFIDGNGGDNLLRGFGGSDRLNGHDGDDTVRGGLGNDTVQASNGEDVLSGGDGRDTFDLGFTDGTRVDLATGRAVIAGEVQAISGFEIVSGGLGNDTVVGSSGSDELRGGSGFDTISGGDGFDILEGESAVDRLDGGSGNDSIAGGASGDNLTGGTGADRFIFRALSDSTVAASDVIEDFDGVTDRIDLSAIDANGATAGDGSFLFGGANFLAVGIASIRVLVSNGNTTVEIRDKDGSAVDMQIELDGVPALTAADFVL
jgi:Ca2+-binding RTX toxin-like protein